MNNKFRNLGLVILISGSIVGSTISSYALDFNQVQDGARGVVQNSKEIVAFMLRPTEKVIEGVKWLYSDDEVVVEVPNIIEPKTVGEDYRNVSNEYMEELQKIQQQLDIIAHKENLTNDDKDFIKANMVKLDYTINRFSDISKANFKAIQSTIDKFTSKINAR